MPATTHGIHKWQTGRAPVTVSDTPLTDYKPADLTAALQAAGKLSSIFPATAVMIRVLGTDAANEAADIIVSGFMGLGGTFDGPGHRLYRGLITLGAKSISSYVPLDDGKWQSGTFLEADTFDHTGAGDYQMSTPTRLDSSITDGIPDQEACLLLPTLGYTHLLFEVVLGTAASIGIIYRPITFERVIQAF